MNAMPSGASGVQQRPIYVSGAASLPPVMNAAYAGMPMDIAPVPVGRDPVIMTCPHCHCRNKTRIEYRATVKTHIACLLLSWTLCFCRLPYRMKSCLNTDHFCQICDAFLGTYTA